MHIVSATPRDSPQRGGINNRRRWRPCDHRAALLDPNQDSSELDCAEQRELLLPPVLGRMPGIVHRDGSMQPRPLVRLVVTPRHLLGLPLALRLRRAGDRPQEKVLPPTLVHRLHPLVLWPSWVPVP